MQDGAVCSAMQGPNWQSAVLTYSTAAAAVDDVGISSYRLRQLEMQLRACFVSD
jgi:hypothetical protein